MWCSRALEKRVPCGPVSAPEGSGRTFPGVFLLARVRTVNEGQRVDWERAVQLFLLEKEAQGRAAVTLTGYQDVLRLFRKRFPEAWPDGVKEASWTFLAENDISPSTYNHRLNSLRQFFAFCVEQGWLAENPLGKFKAKRKESRARLIDVEILRALLTRL